jgi:hypothetical protein
MPTDNKRLQTEQTENTWYNNFQIKIFQIIFWHDMTCEQVIKCWHMLQSKVWIITYWQEMSFKRINQWWQTLRLQLQYG